MKSMLIILMLPIMVHNNLSTQPISASKLFKK
jgi:hypothetical protein